jgi:hypothetical protein
MSVINGAFKASYRLRCKNFVKSYLWENNFADTIFGSNFLCKSFTRHRQITPLLYEFSCYSSYYVSKARSDQRFSEKDDAARGIKWLGMYGVRVADSWQRVVLPISCWVGNVQLPNSEKSARYDMLQRATDLSVLVNTVMNIRAPWRTEVLEQLNNEDLCCDVVNGAM